MNRKWMCLVFVAALGLPLTLTGAEAPPALEVQSPALSTPAVAPLDPLEDRLFLSCESDCDAAYFECTAWCGPEDWTCYSNCGYAWSICGCNCAGGPIWC